MRKCKLKIIALLLLLAFTQKLGLRVLLHNRYHATSVQSSNGNAAAYYQIQCDCLDEALAPLDKTDCAVLPAPAKSSIVLNDDYGVNLSSAIKIYRSLRAPPVA